MGFEGRGGEGGGDGVQTGWRSGGRDDRIGADMTRNCTFFRHTLFLYNGRLGLRISSSNEQFCLCAMSETHSISNGDFSQGSITIQME